MVPVPLGAHLSSREADRRDQALGERVTYQTLNFEGATTDREKIWPAVFGDERAVRCVAEISAEEFFATYVIPRVPVIVTDAASGWAAHRKWTWEWLAVNYGLTDVLDVGLRHQKQA